MTTLLNSLLLAGALSACCNTNAASIQKLSVDGKVREIELSDSQLKVEALNTQLKGTRFLAFSSTNELLIGSKPGVIYRLKAPYKELSGEIRFGGYPHSVAFRQTTQGEELWVAEQTGLYVANYSASKDLSRSDFRLVAALPGGSGHSSRTVEVGPDGRIYVALGITGNCSDEFLSQEYSFNTRRGGILVLDETSGQLSSFVTGLRNPVGFTWSPIDESLYITNNGPDHLGFEEPKELLVQAEAGDFFGMPWYQYVNSETVRDSCIRSNPPLAINAVKKPFSLMPARSAPMAVAVAGEKDLNGKYANQIFIALRGSWGTAPSGSAFGDPASRRDPQIIIIDPETANAKLLNFESLLSGFQLEDGSRWARPVGLRFGPDGALYFTSDSGSEGLFRVSLKN